MRAKKHFGQNFLNSPSIISTIVEVAKIHPQDTVLEIGPGKGSLTHALIQSAAHVVAIEKDSDLIPHLSTEFKEALESQKLELIEGDATEILETYTFPQPFKVVANIPYNITGQLLRQLLTLEHQPTSITLVIQKEVAERIVCRDGKESVLSLSVKIFGSPKYIQKIPARYFTPKPEVDSAIIHIENISRKHIPSKTWEEIYFSVIKSGFAHKRKLLVRNLESVASRDILETSFKQSNIPLTTRAETVSFEKWISLVQSIEQDR